MERRRRSVASDELVLPYLGGPFVSHEGARLRVPAELTPGWWRFSVRAKQAYPEAPAGPTGLDKMPSVRGYLVSGRLVHDVARAEIVSLLPEEEPPVLAPVVARRTPTGELVFDTLGVEGEAERRARSALERGAMLAPASDAPPALFAAFGFALLDRVSGQLGITVSPAEAGAELRGIAEQGYNAAEALLHRLAAERHVAEQARRVKARAEDRRPRPGARPHLDVITPPWLGRGPPPPRRRSRQDEAERRVDEVLSSEGARLVVVERVGADRIEVRFALMGERFVAVADEETLELTDPGIATSGADLALGLGELPRRIRAAIEGGYLVITLR